MKFDDCVSRKNWSIQEMKECIEVLNSLPELNLRSVGLREEENTMAQVFTKETEG